MELRRRGLTNLQIAELLRSLREEVGVHSMMETWASIGQERHALGDIAACADALGKLLLNLRPTTGQRVSLRVAHLGGSVALPAAVAKNLQLLSAAATMVQRSMPMQARPRARIGIVARVKTVVEPMGITVSDDPASRFFGICAQAFVLAGAVSGSAPANPAGAIRALKKLSTPKEA